MLLEANPRYHEMTGGKAVIGSSALQIYPEMEYYWFERFHEVVSTGVATRIENYSGGLGRWFDVYVSRVGGAGSRVYAAVFSEVTERKRREANLAFLSEISRDLVSLTSIDETMSALGAKVGAYLEIDSCAFVEINEASDEAVVRHEWCREGVRSLVGTYRITDFLTAEVQKALRSGESFASNDIHADSRLRREPFSTLGIASIVCTPVIAQDRWQLTVVIHGSKPREWRADQIELMREATARIWARLEHARAEERLQRSAELLDVLIDRSPSGFYIVDADFRIAHMNADSQARAFRNVNPAIGRRFDEAIRILWPEPLATEFIEIFRRTLETGEPYQSPGWSVNGPTSRRWRLTTGSSSALRCLTVVMAWCATTTIRRGCGRPNSSFGKPTGARTNSWPLWRMSCAIPWLPSATVCTTCGGSAEATTKSRNCTR